jgi:hypothetical protein
MTQSHRPPAGTCIFCGKPGKMSREHIWGDWLKAFVPPKMNKHNFHAQRINKPGATPSATTMLKAGDPLRAKVRVVCASCNNTWLSQLQQQAKPHLIPLIQGQRTALGSTAQERVAAWCAMATMTAEFIDPDPHSIAVSPADRDWLMQNRTAPPGWRIWIGNYRRKNWIPRWVHFTFPMLEAHEMPAQNDPIPPYPNTQATTFTVGQLYVHAMSSAYPKTIEKWYWGLGPAPLAGRLLAPAKTRWPAAAGVRRIRYPLRAPGRYGRTGVFAISVIFPVSDFLRTRLLCS